MHTAILLVEMASYGNPSQDTSFILCTKPS